jgi:elongation factor P
MIRAGEISKGVCLIMKNEPYLVVEREFVNPGKGSAFVRLKLKGLRTGQTLRETMRTNDSAEDANVEERDVQYMYEDQAGFHFMDNKNYEQFSVPLEGMENKKFFLKEGESYRIVEWEGTPIDIKIPYKIVLKVTEAYDALKGDTVTGATKSVKLETGFEVRVPLFIKQGEKILINTETGEYVERVND